MEGCNLSLSNSKRSINFFAMEGCWKRVDSSGDRISGLPIEIKMDILSLVSIKSAVRMCAVSKAWVGLWTSSPNLLLDQAEFLPDDNPLAPRFVRFVNRVLAVRRRNVVPTSLFELRWHRHFDIKKVAIWLNYAMNHKVRELVLRIGPTPMSLWLPTRLFRYSSLESLTLQVLDDDFFFLTLDKSMNWTQLRVLRLDGMLTDSTHLGLLLSSSPLLEDLRIGISDGCVIHTSAPNLKVLHLRCLMEDQGSEIHISTPRLQELHCTFVKVVPGINLGDVPLLTAGYLKCCGIEDGNGDKLSRILASLRNVRILHLLQFTIKTLTSVPNLWKCMSLPFCHVKQLVMDMFPDKDNMRFIIILLRSFPKLKNLEIHNLKARNFQTELSRVEDDQKLKSEWSFDHLERIEMFRFLGSEDELELINLLLKHARTLRKILINHKTELQNRKTWADISDYVHAIPRASTTAEIEVIPVFN